jgi:hypothetical protein
LLVLESEKKLYEKLLWEHRELSDTHNALQAAHQKSQGGFFHLGLLL